MGLTPSGFLYRKCYLIVSMFINLLADILEKFYAQPLGKHHAHLKKKQI